VRTCKAAPDPLPRLESGRVHLPSVRELWRSGVSYLP
jgi:hypothetical protein